MCTAKAQKKSIEQFCVKINTRILIISGAFVFPACRSQGTSAFACSTVGIAELPAEAAAVKHFRDHQE